MSNSLGAYKAFVIKLNKHNYNQWKTYIKNLMFLKKAGTQPATLTRRATLDTAFFEDHEDFHQEYARLVADETVPDDPLSTDGFMNACFTFAMERGVGFIEWVYPVYAEVFASLTPEMQEQVEADKYGNLIELFENIDLALRRTEIFSTSELKKIFFRLRRSLCAEAPDRCSRTARSSCRTCRPQLVLAFPG